MSAQCWHDWGYWGPWRHVPGQLLPGVAVTPTEGAMPAEGFAKAARVRKCRYCGKVQRQDMGTMEIWEPDQ